MREIYVCGRCGGQMVCIYTSKDELVTAHVFCGECDKEALESGRTKANESNK